MSYWGYKPYVNVAQRRAKATRSASKLAEDGRKCCPVQIDGRAIAKTFWGKGWCDNLASYSDFSNRLPRGATYVRNGSVVDLQIEPGKVIAIVCGSEVYDIKIDIKPLAPKMWSAIKTQCAGQIASIVELLQGKLSKGVMEIITAHEGGLFPKPAEISLDCSCPDWANMCKHVAAALYGVGSRLDQQPELLFTLRQVDHLELIEGAGTVDTLPARGGHSRNTIAGSDLSDVFGIEIADSDSPPATLSEGSTAPVKSVKKRMGAKVIKSVGRTVTQRTKRPDAPTASVKKSSRRAKA